MAWTYEVHELSEGFSAIVYDEHGRRIADHLTEEQARLVAAAPDMLEALEKAKETIRAWHGPVAWEIYDRASPEMKMINAAIAKAGGAS